MTPDDIAIRLLWVAAYHGLRRHGTERTMPRDEQVRCWQLVHDISDALGNPPAPGGPR